MTVPDDRSDTRIYDILAWLEVNKKRILITFLIATAIGFAMAIYRYIKTQKEHQASAALIDLRPPLNAPTNYPPTQASAYFKIAEQFRGTEAAERAKILGATALFNENNYVEAKSRFEEFLKDHPNSPWAPIAMLGVGNSLEAQNKPEEALGSLQGLLTKYPDSAVVTDAKLAIARIHESQKKPEMALQIYEELSRGAGAQQGDSQAAARREALLKAYPHLRKTNAPAASTNLAATNLTGMLKTNLQAPQKAITTNK